MQGMSGNEGFQGRRKEPGMIDELYAACHKELVGWCAAMTRDLPLAEDLVQEAFLRALVHEEVLKVLTFHQRRAWLYRTVKNLYVDRQRHASFEKVTGEFPEEGAEAAEYVQVDYEQLLAGLPEEERMLFILRYVEGYNATELGRLFDLPPGTIRSRLSGARRHLREAMRGCCPGRRKGRNPGVCTAAQDPAK